MQTRIEQRNLLAVSLGLRCGVALFGHDGRLRWYRAQHFSNLSQVRRGAGRLLGRPGETAWLISEGEVSLAAIWERIAMRQGVRVQRLSAATWRHNLLGSRPAVVGASQTQPVQSFARRVISWSGAPAPTELEADAAAAILIGLWGVISLGWLQAVPPALHHEVPRLAQMYR